MGLKKYACVIVPYRSFSALRDQFGVNLRWLGGIAALFRFAGEYRAYARLEGNPRFAMKPEFIIPCLTDRTASTPLEPTYFFQNSWAAGKIFRLGPAHHCDVGSSAVMVGIVSQFVPTTMVDIRPIELSLPNLHFRAGSILQLPFADDSVESLSSLCVVEHIGLGRYGDPIDPWGSEKAARELKRVLKTGGNLLFSVPVDKECRVYFNAHRAFTREYVLSLFEGLELVEEKYVYGQVLQDTYDGAKGFGTGLYHFAKAQ
jgi:SAM-dependent methyltransferase